MLGIKQKYNNEVSKLIKYFSKPNDRILQDIMHVKNSTIKIKPKYETKLSADTTRERERCWKDKFLQGCNANQISNEIFYNNISLFFVMKGYLHPESVQETAIRMRNYVTM